MKEQGRKNKDEGMRMKSQDKRAQDEEQKLRTNTQGVAAPKPGQAFLSPAQVHPTARSKRPCHPILNTIQPSAEAFVTAAASLGTRLRPGISQCQHRSL